MPRASRYLLPGYTYHLTQRCTDREFLLKFDRDRKVYRHWLRIGALRHGVPVLGYCLMSSHTHLLVQVDDVEAVGAFMDLVAGSTAQQYNRRKKRSGAFWEPYQCTIVEAGHHLFNCLCYVDLNMVRAGGAAHPSRWRWCGWGELMGQRQRYRILDTERLLQLLEMDSIQSFRGMYAAAIDEAIARDRLRREAHWTEALAVGSEQFVRRAAARYDHRYRLEYRQQTSSTAEETWTVRESTAGEHIWGTKMHC